MLCVIFFGVVHIGAAGAGECLRLGSGARAPAAQTCFLVFVVFMEPRSIITCRICRHAIDVTMGACMEGAHELRANIRCDHPGIQAPVHRAEV